VVVVDAHEAMAGALGQVLDHAGLSGAGRALEEHRATGHDDPGEVGQVDPHRRGEDVLPGHHRLQRPPLQPDVLKVDVVGPGGLRDGHRG
jgi:hypothetical protein